MKPLITIVALAGKAGAGKDTILRYLCDNYDVHEIVSCTTRPMREGEVDGVNYHFITPEQFAEKVLRFEMIEATEFNGWFYGTDIAALSADKINIGVFNLAGVEALREDPQLHIIPLLVETSDKARLMRQLTREENPNVHEIIRRFKTDEEDFEDIENYGLVQNDDGMFPQNAETLARLLNLGKVK